MGPRGKNNKVAAEGGEAGGGHQLVGASIANAPGTRSNRRTWLISGTGIVLVVVLTCAVAIPLSIRKASTPSMSYEEYEAADFPSDTSSADSKTESAVASTASPIPSPPREVSSPSPAGGQPSQTGAAVQEDEAVPPATAARPAVPQPTTHTLLDGDGQAVFDAAYPVYRASSFPQLAETAAACLTPPATLYTPLVHIPTQNNLTTLRPYETLEQCLSCCADGCQAYDLHLRGRDCVEQGEVPEPSSPPETGAEALPEPSDPSAWLQRPLGREYHCSFDYDYGKVQPSVTETCTPESDDNSTHTCSRFMELETCFDCCSSCMVDGPSTLFTGRDCLPVSSWVIAIPGRPLIDAASGLGVVAPLVSSRHGVNSSWTHQLSGQDVSPGYTDPEAAAAWEKAAQGEHASVASFSTHLLQLMAVGGAPPEILEAVATAAADEVRHAAKALAVAALLRGPGVLGKEPGPLPVPTSSGSRPSLPSLMVDVLQEGCLEETVSAAMAVAAVQSAHLDSGQDGPALREAQAAVRAIAREEAQHALLAWRTLAWGLEASRDKSVLAAVGEASRRLRRGAPKAEGYEPVAVTPSHGLVVRPEDARQVRQAVQQGLVLPWLEMLLAGEGLPDSLGSADGPAGAMHEVLARVLAGQAMGRPAQPPATHGAHWGTSEAEALGATSQHLLGLRGHHILPAVLHTEPEL